MHDADARTHRQPRVGAVKILVGNVLLEEAEYTVSCFYSRALCHRAADKSASRCENDGACRMTKPFKDPLSPGFILIHSEKANV